MTSPKALAESEKARQAEQEKEDIIIRRDPQTAKFVVLGGLAAIALWLFVLVTGSPIAYFEGHSLSFVYALVVSLPAIGVSLFALKKAVTLQDTKNSDRQ